MMNNRYKIKLLALFLSGFSAISAISLTDAHSTELIYSKIGKILSGEVFDASNASDGIKKRNEIYKSFSKKLQHNSHNVSNALEYPANYGESGLPLPQLKQEAPLNTVIPNQNIYKKQYNRENEHLPRIVYTSEYNDLLFKAVVEGQLPLIHSFVTRLGSTEIKDKEGNTPIMLAILADNMASLQVLLGMDAALNATNSFGLAPLHIAILHNHTDATLALLEWGADVNQKDSHGLTPLMMALKVQNIAIFDMLISAGADIKATAIDGSSVMHFAMQAPSAQFMSRLAKAGVDINQATYSGSTPLQMAVAQNNLPLINTLFALGAEIPDDNEAQNALSRAAYQARNLYILELVEAKRILASLTRGKINSIEPVSLTVDDKESTPFAPIPKQKPWFKDNGKKLPKPYFSNDVL
jgi:ankyrin repeat protein